MESLEKREVVKVHISKNYFIFGIFEGLENDLLVLSSPTESYYGGVIVGSEKLLYDSISSFYFPVCNLNWWEKIEEEKQKATYFSSIEKLEKDRSLEVGSFTYFQSTEYSKNIGILNSVEKTHASFLNVATIKNTWNYKDFEIVSLSKSLRTYHFSRLLFWTQINDKDCKWYKS